MFFWYFLKHLDLNQAKEKTVNYLKKERKKKLMFPLGEASDLYFIKEPFNQQHMMEI